MEINTESKYCYKGTSILKNKLGIMNSQKLFEIEKRIVSIKLIALIKKGITGEFDINHFKSIHYFLFCDIFDFAGEFRTENIAKLTFRFAEYEYIESELTRLLNELKKENYLKDYEYEIFIKKLAYYMAEFNVLHPFREGNGRTYREFIRQLALYNGYNLNWSKINRTTIYKATIKAIIDNSELEDVLDNCIEKN